MLRRQPFVAAAILCAASVGQTDLRSQTVVLEPYVVTATRNPEPPSDVPGSVRIVGSDELINTPALTLDGALRSVPGFSLFRRSDSLSAHPTTQGVSLRGLGPSGASRTLVLLDGVPVNDPFGGWVAWSKLPRLGLDRVEILRGAGATAWGNAALGGVVQLVSRQPDSGHAMIQTEGGTDSLASVEFVAAQPAGNGVLELSGSLFTTGGFKVVASGDRGPVDVAAWQRHRWIGARWFAPIARDTEVRASVRLFSEKRGNGTLLQRNRSRDSLGSVEVVHHPNSGLRWTASLFAEDESFSSTFSSVSADRTTEAPASNQFAVPASSWGLAWTGTIDSGASGTTTAGVDFRDVRGKTNEDSAFSNGAFTRRRVAGGKQRIAGLFAMHSLDLAGAVRLDAGVRADRWDDLDGFRRESLISTGEITRDDKYPSRSGWELSPNAGLVWRASPGMRFRASAQRAFRRPTLNELYRPFRVGSIITESNPDLNTETVATFETGVDWSCDPFNASVTLFHHDLHDAVANVTMVHGPGNFAGFGFIPAGGIGRKRLNLDSVVVQGAELSATLKIGTATKCTFEYLISDARVRNGQPDVALNGTRLAQVPMHSATLSLSWAGPSGLKVTPRIRAFSRQFEDDENLLPLAGAVVADLEASVSLGSSRRLFVLVENIADTTVETGKSAAGVTSTGTPRSAVIGIRIGL